MIPNSHIFIGLKSQWNICTCWWDASWRSLIKCPLETCLELAGILDQAVPMLVLQPLFWKQQRLALFWSAPHLDLSSWRQHQLYELRWNLEILVKSIESSIHWFVFILKLSYYIPRWNVKTAWRFETIKSGWSLCGSSSTRNGRTCHCNCWRASFRGIPSPYDAIILFLIVYLCLCSAVWKIFGSGLRESTFKYLLR